MRRQKSPFPHDKSRALPDEEKDSLFLLLLLRPIVLLDVISCSFSICLLETTLTYKNGYCTFDGHTN